MMDMNMEPKTSHYPQYQKRIIPYLDGSLSPEEKSEFEAFVRTHPEFESLIKVKQDELSLLKSLIPAATLSASSLESLESEMKLSVFNLLKEEPRNLIDSLKNSWEEWINR